MPALRQLRTFVLASLPLMALILFQSFHCIAFPLVVTYDGHLYVELAHLFAFGGETVFAVDWARWDFLRTPLYPLLLKLAFLVCGETALAIKLIGATFGAAAVVCAYWLFRSFSSRPYALVAATLVAINPYFVAYQHMALTEAGSTFFLVVLVYLTVRARTPRSYAALGLWLFVSFAYRPNFLYLSPFVAFALLLADWTLIWRNTGVASKSVLSIIFFVLVLPVLVTHPYLAKSRASGRMGDQYVTGLVRQGTIPPEDTRFDPIRHIALFGKYAATLGRYQESGWPLSGVSGDLLYPFTNLIRAHSDLFEPTDLFAYAVRTYPSRYLSGVRRTFLHFCGLRGAENENLFLVGLVFDPAHAHNTILAGPEQTDARIRATFGGASNASRFTTLMRRLYAGTLPAWSRITFASCCAFFALALVGLLATPLLKVPVPTHRAMLAAGSICTGYFLIHSVLLMAFDRHVVCAYPIMLALCYSVILHTLCMCMAGLYPGREATGCQAAITREL